MHVSGPGNGHRSRLGGALDPCGEGLSIAGIGEFASEQIDCAGGIDRQRRQARKIILLFKHQPRCPVAAANAEQLGIARIAGKAKLGAVMKRNHMAARIENPCEHSGAAQFAWTRMRIMNQSDAQSCLLPRPLDSANVPETGPC